MNLLAPTEMSSGSEAGSYLRPIDSRITQLKAQGPSRTCNESKEGEKKGLGCTGDDRHEEVEDQERAENRRDDVAVMFGVEGLRLGA